jgi:hypothetical protein
MGQTRQPRAWSILLVAVLALVVGVAGPEAWAKKEVVPLSEARIFFEYNSSANDLGVHVRLDGEDWRTLKITGPNGRTFFDVQLKGGYRGLGGTELFFEGAEPNLADVPLDELLDRFPAGEYQFSGRDVDGNPVEGTATLSHAIPRGPANVTAVVGPGNSLVIMWAGPGTDPPNGFPDATINIVAYQVIVGKFEVTIPGGAVGSFGVTVTPEFVASLPTGAPIEYEVLAIADNGNQSITEGAPFVR